MSKILHSQGKSVFSYLQSLLLLIILSASSSSRQSSYHSRKSTNSYNILKKYRLTKISMSDPDSESPDKASSSRDVLIRQLYEASNGFDMRGCTSPSTDGPLLTNEAAFWIGIGFGEYIRERSNLPSNSVLRIGLGHDPRESGKQLLSWLAAGIEQSGEFLEAYDLGLCTTPSMYLSCSQGLLETISTTGPDMLQGPWPFDGAISITASHLPSIWNGFKFFTPDHPTNIGEEGIQAVLQYASDKKWDYLRPRLIQDAKRSNPFLPVYSEFLKSTVRRLLQTSHQESVAKPLTGLKILVNAGNGAGGFLARTLSDLGADVSGSLNLNPDGTFPNHIPNPEDRKAISTTADAAVRTGADIGVCLDCDADRVGLVDGKTGLLVNRNNLVALVSKIALENEQMISQGTIVTDSATSNGINRFIKSLNGKHVRYKKGYRYVIEKARSIEDSVLAIECSGHGAWRDNGWIDDGCYTAVRVICHFAKAVKEFGSSQSSYPTLSSLIGGYSDPVESKEFRLKSKLPRDLFGDLSHKVVEDVKTMAENTDGWFPESVNYEGIRVNFNDGDGWLMVRSSLHEPIVSMHIESDTKGGIKYAVAKIMEVLETYIDMLDLEPLRTYRDER